MRTFTSILTLSLLGLTACSSAPVLTITVSPPEADVYMNGVLIQQGSSRPASFDFTKCDRIYLLAVHESCEPLFEWFDPQKVQQMLARKIPVNMVLNQR
jgi:hypothetical protein